MNKSLRKQSVLIGLTIFSMLFGAGNLIFPPLMGFLAGTESVAAMAGFGISSVGLPIAAIIIMSKGQNTKEVATNVSPLFATIFLFLVYMAIGPFLAIPRTAMTSFEMTVGTVFGSGVSTRVIFSFLFFGLASIFAFKPEKLYKIFGKFMAPILITLIVIVFFGVLISSNSIGAASGKYLDNTVVNGFIDGYQTMDTLAGLIFVNVIWFNVREFKLSDEDSRYVLRHGAILTAVLMIAIYSVLTYIGAASGATNVTNGALVLIAATKNIYGKAGLIVLGSVFLIACFNTCVGLLCSLGDYLSTTINKLSYKNAVLITALISGLISILGLDNILLISVPILSLAYPVAITLIVLRIFDKYYFNKGLVYRTAIYLVTTLSIITVLDSIGVVIPFVTLFARMIPFYSVGLGFVVPMILSILITKFIRVK